MAREDLMYNDFVIVGPESDPAGLNGSTDVTAALVKLSESEALFASRGDDSGTHKRERALWTAAGIDPTAASGGWYRETGSGMGATLNTGIGMGAYVMTDRATWISFDNKQDYTIHVEGDEALAKPFGLDFLPVVEERFDLLVDRRAYFEPPFQRLLEFSRTDQFANRAKTLGGYSIEGLGSVRWSA